MKIANHRLEMRDVPFAAISINRRRALQALAGIGLGITGLSPGYKNYNSSVLKMPEPQNRMLDPYKGIVLLKPAVCLALNVSVKDKNGESMGFTYANLIDLINLENPKFSFLLDSKTQKAPFNQLNICNPNKIEITKASLEAAYTKLGFANLSDDCKSAQKALEGLIRHFDTISSNGIIDISTMEILLAKQGIPSCLQPLLNSTKATIDTIKKLQLASLNSPRIYAASTPISK